MVVAEVRDAAAVVVGILTKAPVVVGVGVEVVEEGGEEPSEVASINVGAAAQGRDLNRTTG